MNDRAAITGVVQAGGKSRRMGRDKALLELGGQTLLARAVATLRRITPDVLVVGPPARQHHAAGARVVPDAYPESGPLGGIATALLAAATARVAVVACDMPFLNAELLAYLASLDPDADAVVPRMEGQPEPLHAVYARASLPVMQEQLAAGDLRVANFLARVRVRYVEEPELRAVDPDLRSFFNINTPADLEAAGLALNGGGPLAPPRRQRAPGR